MTLVQSLGNKAKRKHRRPREKLWTKKSRPKVRPRRTSAHKSARSERKSEP